MGLSVNADASSEAGAACDIAARLLDELFPSVLAALRHDDDAAAMSVVPFLQASRTYRAAQGQVRVGFALLAYWRGLLLLPTYACRQRMFWFSTSAGNAAMLCRLETLLLSAEACYLGTHAALTTTDRVTWIVFGP